MFLVLMLLLVLVLLLLRLLGSDWSGGDIIFLHTSAVGLRMAWQIIRPGYLSRFDRRRTWVTGGMCSSPRTWRTRGPQAAESGTR